MSANPKRKMCWNCEGNIELNQEVCPYCQTTFEPHHESTSLHSQNLYPSPYNQPKIIAANPFGIEQAHEHEEQEEAEQSDALDTALFTLYTMGLLMMGTVFLLFSIVLFAFSHNGQLVLKWNSANWYIYFLLAIPMLYFSMRALKMPPEE